LWGRKAVQDLSVGPAAGVGTAGSGTACSKVLSHRAWHDKRPRFLGTVGENLGSSNPSRAFTEAQWELMRIMVGGRACERSQLG
jgi:hypothetical protein